MLRLGSKRREGLAGRRGDETRVPSWVISVVERRRENLGR